VREVDLCQCRLINGEQLGASRGLAPNVGQLLSGGRLVTSVVFNGVGFEAAGGALVRAVAVGDLTLSAVAGADDDRFRCGSRVG
jgi:hypothetical protein